MTGASSQPALDAERAPIEDLVGQLVMAGYPGAEPTEALRRLIQERGLGGVILFARNCPTVEQVRAAVAQIQRWAREAGRSPLLVGVDQEGGRVARLPAPATTFPSAMAFGATGDADLVERCAQACGEELRALGINLNFAPCLDVNNNPRNPVINLRSYGADPTLVAELGVAAVRGYQRARIAATAKHFPGHGDTAVDSHLALPSVPHPRQRLDAVELVPFRAAIAAGVDAIMSAHVQFPAVEPDGLPATLSRRALHDLLRAELGFDGAIVTDDMEMRGITGRGPTERAVIRAIAAGADLTLVSHTIERQVATLDGLQQAVSTGRLAEARLREAAGRVLRLKARIDLAASEEHSPFTGHAGLAAEAALRSISADSAAGVLPLEPGKPLAVLLGPERRASAAAEGRRRNAVLAGELRRRCPESIEVPLAAAPDEDQIRAACAAATACGRVVVCLRAVDPAMQDLLRALTDLRLPTVLACLSTPYLREAVPPAWGWLVTYGDTPVALAALAAVLFGEAPARGQVPVT